MPRRPQEDTRRYSHCNYFSYGSCDENIDLKLQLLQEKLNKKIEEKQDKLIAGENITIENNVISAANGSGDVVFDDYFQIGKEVGYLSQGGEVFPGTSVKNLLLHMLERKEPVDEMLAYFYDGDVLLEEGE